MTAALAEGFATYQREQRQREEELAAPAAVEEREASRYVYADLTPAEAEELLLSRFGLVLQALNKEPARYLSDAKLEAVMGPDAATVTSEGETALFESSVPVRAEDEEGDLSKVDVSLVEGEEGWEPVNPLIDLEIGAAVEEGVEITDANVAITQVGAEDSVARRLGDKNIFYGEVEQGSDTDLMVSPTSTGVELFNLLRSADSPETLRFHVEMPAGATLRENEAGAAEVIDANGDVLVAIARPLAIDAQGSDVPVTMAVEGESIVLEVNHRDEDLAYPILVDPELRYQDWGWWYQGQHLSGLGAFDWAPVPTPWWINHGTESSGFPSYKGKGLFISTAPGSLGANQWGHYVYSAPNAGTFLADATVNPLWRNNRECASPNPNYQPFDYVGMWNGTSYNRLLFNKSNELGWANMETWGNALMIGVTTNSSGTSIPCWRDFMIGGVGILLDDLQYPYLDSVGPTPEGWVKKDGTPRTFSVTASDAGLGVRTVRAFGVGTQSWPWSRESCAGTYEQRCPNSASGQITFKTEGFPYEGRYNGEGKERKFTIQVVDPTDKTWQLERPLWVDGTEPLVTLKGQLAAATDQVGSVEKSQETEAKDDQLSIPTYKLEIEADDGADRSGVKEIKVFLDGKSTPEEVKPASCGTSCPQKLTMDYTLRLPGLAPGGHSLRIVAVDKVGNETDPNRNIEFEYIPATGMKEEYVLQHFRLPDGNDYSGEAEYHGPEITVNVMNGNVVFHERDVDVDTDRADLELERVYNSQQPNQEDTQWGRGWSITQAPELEPEPGPSPQEATETETGKIVSSVPLPQSQSQTTFSSNLHATITKTATGYEVEPAVSPEVEVFDASGRIEEVVQGDDAPVQLEPEKPDSSPPTYANSFGSMGSFAGQFKHPAGIATNDAGLLWIVDQDNDKVKKFNTADEFKGTFGSSGTGDGQFSRPTDIAIDAAGNLWVVDAGSNRIQKFSAEGKFLAKFGSSGSGNGQFNSPESIAIDAKGNIWIADTYSHRLQKFNSNFEFIKAVGSWGYGQGQLVEPTGIDVSLGGNVWVAEWGNNRISVFSESGEFIRQFGSYGTGSGQFRHPDAIEADSKGNVWVGDQDNNRVQRFNQDGKYITSFGTSGSGQGQFGFGWPMGIASDADGNLWVSDTGNNRVQRWSAPDSLGVVREGGPAPYFDAPAVDYEYAEGRLTGIQLEDEATEGEDPALEMSLSGGLVSEVESEEAGDTTYGYESGRLATVAGGDGQAQFGYDPSDRLESVTLPNGTVATIAYDGTSRATSVKVDPAGPEGAKATNFSYSTDPRRTTVWGGGNPEIIYDIGEDGGVVHWAYAETPPTIASISGSLWSKRGEEIENKDHTLFVTGSSPHQVASIKVVANGDSVVAEATCEDPAEPPSHVCDQPAPLEWITHPSEHAPGRMDLEVVVTDFLGHQTAERFFVVVPQQPPPGSETVERPNFKAIKVFREEYGLDRNNPRTQSQMNELILELLYEWEKRDQTAMTAVENWGVPMRAPELSEMEWRRQYIDQAAEAIPQWAEENAPATFGGYYVDDRAGGKIYVGFTGTIQAQASLVEALKQSGALVNPSQVFPFPLPPDHSLADLHTSQDAVQAAIMSNSAVQAATVSIGVPEEGNQVRVGATDVPLVDSFLDQQFGQAAPIVVVARQPLRPFGYSRFSTEGPAYGGQALQGENYERCTAGFSTRAPSGSQSGKQLYKYFLLSAGHCYSLGTAVGRLPSRNAPSSLEIGEIKRTAWAPEYAGDSIGVDALAILIDKALRSHSVLNASPSLKAEPIQGVQQPHKWACWSGVNGGSQCGRIVGAEPFRYKGHISFVYEVKGVSAEGDSGAPVWDPFSHKAIGSLVGGVADCWTGGGDREWCARSAFTPLLGNPIGAYPESALGKMGLEVLLQE